MLLCCYVGGGHTRGPLICTEQRAVQQPPTEDHQHHALCHVSSPKVTKMDRTAPLLRLPLLEGCVADPPFLPFQPTLVPAQ